MNRTAAIRLAASLPKGDPRRRGILARLASDKKTAKRRTGGPVDQIVGKYWDLLHDLERDLEKAHQEYDMAMSYRGGPGERQARLVFEKIDNAKRAVATLTSELFHDMFDSEFEFVQKHGKPSDYVVERRNKMIPR